MAFIRRSCVVGMVFFFLLGGAENEVCVSPGEVNSDKGTEAYNINKTVWSKLHIKFGKIINNLIHHHYSDPLDAYNTQQYYTFGYIF